MTRVHDTDSATENYRPGSSGIRVKTQGKSLRLPAVMQVAGKPYMLKCHVYYVPHVRGGRLVHKAAMLCVVGRQLDPFSNERAR